MRQIFCLAVLTLCAVAAYGDGVPIDNLTQGTVNLSSINAINFSIGWSFAGSGQNLSGFDSWGTCFDFAPGGSSCSPSLAIGLNQNGAVLNGTPVDYAGGATLTGGNFLLPTTGTNFSITLPVLFQGTFNVCPYSPLWGISYGCTSSNLTGIFNLNGTGTVTLSFSSFGTGNGIVWQLTGATYTLTSTPEPASIVLLGTGALAILGKLRRRRG